MAKEGEEVDIASRPGIRRIPALSLLTYTVTPNHVAGRRPVVRWQIPSWRKSRHSSLELQRGHRRRGGKSNLRKSRGQEWLVIRKIRVLQNSFGLAGPPKIPTYPCPKSELLRAILGANAGGSPSF